MVHEEDIRPQNEKSHAYHLALLITDVNFAYWPLLQFLLSPNAYLKALSHYNILANVCRRMKYISITLAYAEIW